MAVVRPRLRPVEAILVPDEDGGRSLMLRDPEGVAEDAVVLPAWAAAVVGRMDGRRTTEEIAAAAERAVGRSVSPATVARLVEELDGALLLESPAYRRRRAALEREFTESPVRPASHAGGAYHGDPGRLARYIDDECLARATDEHTPSGTMTGLCAPHMDLWRAAAGYGHAYGALRTALADGCSGVDTFVVLGTSHARMERPFSVCAKAFDTPLGPMEADMDAIDELQRGACFDVHADAYNHRREHSVEFQVVFLRHLVGRRPVTLIPILCSLGGGGAGAFDPATDRATDSFVTALQSVVGRRAGRVLVIAGADLAHVGPRFGDRQPLDATQRRALAEHDRHSVARAVERNAAGFFSHVVADIDTRRVCGTGPIYGMLRALPAAARGQLLHYDQCVDAQDGSIVSHASVGFYG